MLSSDVGVTAYVMLLAGKSTTSFVTALVMSSVPSVNENFQMHMAGIIVTSGRVTSESKTNIVSVPEMAAKLALMSSSVPVWSLAGSFGSLKKPAG